jgi:uncharacterized membrane protein YdbT with pleckstrin-like domain
VWLLCKYLQWRCTYFVVTSRRVIYRTGFLSKRGVEIPLERVANINFRQRLFERVIGAGNLEIESAGREGQSRFDFIRHPDGVQHEIYRQMEARSTRQAAAPAPGPPAAAPPSVPDQIQALARLRDAGDITNAEYEQKKAELLERM